MFDGCSEFSVEETIIGAWYDKNKKTQFLTTNQKVVEKRLRQATQNSCGCNGSLQKQTQQAASVS